MMRLRSPLQTQTICLAAILLLAAGALLSACQVMSPQPPAKLTLALPALEQNALIYVAEHEGMFSRNGLEVKIDHHDSGVTAMSALLQNKADIAVTAEFPAVRSAMKGAPISILASIDKFDNNMILARQDRGIEREADLKGKRIGVARQTIAEFFLGRFLELNGIALADVTLVDVPPGQFASSIEGGQVDALIAWQPHAYAIQQAVSGLVAWPAQNNQNVYGLIVTRQDWLKNNPDLAAKLLRSLAEAETYVIHNDAQAQAIVRERLQYEPGYLDSVWRDHHFSLTLDHSLIAAMDGEARWLIKNNLASTASAPDFQEWIASEPLFGVKPESVEIKR